MSLVPGTQLGPYEIEAQVGAGGMGEVYRARDPRLGRAVAVKILPVAVAGDPERRQRFESEARAASALNHPGIVSVFDVGFHDERPYLVTELLEGTTLRERLAAGPLATRKALDLARQLADALAAAHDRGIVHRDLKPENLFVLRDGRLKILDFGLAKAVGPRTGTSATSDTEATATAAGTVLGTAGYMAPEQVRGQTVDHRADLFAFGAIFYEMLAGQRAFGGETPVERAHAILKDEPPAFTPERAVPAAVEWLVWRCLEKAPEQRLQSARDLAFSLEALAELSSGTLAAVPATPRPRRALAVVLGAFVLVGTVGGVAYVAGRTSAPRRAPTVAAAPAPAPSPHYQRISFRRGGVGHARFAPDGTSVVYAAAFDSSFAQVYTTIPGKPDARPLYGPATGLFAVSRTGELALAVRSEKDRSAGPVLARASLAGGAPRAVLARVQIADWSPDGSELLAVRRLPDGVRIEYPIGTVLYQTAVGNVGDARVSPGGDQVAFFNLPRTSDTRGTLDVVDRRGRRRTLAGPFADLRGLAWTPDGHEIWFTGTKAGLANTLQAVTLAGAQRVVTETPGTLTIEDIDRNGRVLLRRDDLRYRIQGQGPGDSQPRDLSWFDGSLVADLSPDGKKLLFLEGLDAAPTEVVSYLRDTDGSPAVRLGTGKAFALSPDGQWALHSPRFPYDHAQLLPTGVGEPRPLAPGSIVEYMGGRFFPDGRSILIVGRAAGRPPRLWVQRLDGSPPRPLTAEGTSTSSGPISPDGKRVVVILPDHRAALVSAAGGEPVPIRGLTPGERPEAWSENGKALYFVEPDQPSFPIRVGRLDLATGHKTPWRELGGVDPSATRSHHGGRLVADGRAWAVSYVQYLSDLYLVTGLR
jgi:Tol biopolymer transport system component